VTTGGHRIRHQDGPVRLAVGMPLIRKLEPGLWEVRSQVANGIARVLFTVEGDTMVLLHGFVKKSQRTPANDLKITRHRLAQLKTR